MWFRDFRLIGLNAHSPHTWHSKMVFLIKDISFTWGTEERSTLSFMETHSSTHTCKHTHTNACRTFNQAHTQTALTCSLMSSRSSPRIWLKMISCPIRALVWSPDNPQNKKHSGGNHFIQCISDIVGRIAQLGKCTVVKMFEGHGMVMASSVCWKHSPKMEFTSTPTVGSIVESHYQLQNQLDLVLCQQFIYKYIHKYIHSVRP